jgi:hypothetical protein
MAGLDIDWSSFGSHGRWALFFFALPLGLVLTTHLVHVELRYPPYSFWDLIKLALTPYFVFWVCVDLVGMASYLPRQLVVLGLGLTILVLLFIGPAFGKYMIKRVLKCSPDETNEFYMHWSIANIILAILIAFALPAR